MDDIKKPKKRLRFLKLTLVIVVISGIILGFFAWYLNRQWRPRLKQTIQNTLIDASDSLYRVDFKNIGVNILTGTVNVDSIFIRPNLRVYQQMRKKGIAPENIFELKITKLILKKVNPVKVYRYRKLEIKDITIQEPSLTVYYARLKNKKKNAEDHRTAFDRLKSVLKELKVGTLFLADVDFKYVDQSLKNPKTISLRRMNIRMTDILIDSTSQKDSNRLFSTKDIQAEINDYVYATPDSMYHLDIKHAYLSTQKKQFVVSGVSLIPRYGDIAFSNHFDVQQERYQFLFDSVLVDKINFNNLIESRTVSTSKLQVLNGDFSVFLNRDKPKKSVDKGRNFPQFALKRVGWGINADTVLFKNINVSYTEYNPKTESKGTVVFSELNGNVLNVTNDSLALLKNHLANADLEAKLMGKGDLNIHLTFDLTDPLASFSYSGFLGSMNTSVLNPITKPLAMLMTSSGKINRMDFDFKGNLNKAEGTLKLHYSDLNLVLMKRGERDNFKKMGLISLFANALLVEAANPAGNQPLRVVHPYCERPLEASFFNLMWKAIYIGVKQSVGITEEKEKRFLQRAEDFKDAKAHREQRRLERQQQRADQQED
ncbi:MAG: hypothetical protein IE931_11490 [Sphingobacteriales bacterium]|nr:hypothetical protein [Sphingobacteriales bacterium]